MATTTFWVGNAPAVAEVDSLTVSAVATGGVLTATMGIAPYTVSVSYTCVVGDTTSTAAAALQALLAASLIPQFAEATYSVTTNVITCTAQTPGTPFTLTASGSGGATLTRAAVTASVSPSDVANAANWVRGGVSSLPQATDDLVLANSDVPLLWNLTALKSIGLSSFTRWQSFTASVGLPENNPSGYVEYRPTYLQLAGPNGTLTVVLGQGSTGTGPTRERYDFQTFRYALTVLAAGVPDDDYAVRVLGTNASNTLLVTGTSVAVAMLPGETANVAGTASAVVVAQGGSLALGQGVTFGGTLTLYSGSATVNCSCTILAYTGSTVTVGAQDATGGASSSSSPGAGGGQSVTIAPLTYPAVTARDGSTVTWNSDAALTTLLMTNGSVLDASLDVRPFTVTNSTVDADCLINDPNNRITFSNPTSINNALTAGPFNLGPGRTLKAS